jgi:DNA-binding response OmpR family regulator
LPTGTHADGQPRRVLVVEESYLLRDALSDLLRVFGMAPVGLVGTLAKAMALASAETFDAALAG